MPVTDILSAAIFALSGVILALGLTGKVWADAVMLSQLNTQSIAAIERTHPHLPSLRVVTGIALCAAALLGVALAAVSEAPSAWNQATWIVLAALFCVLAAAGILAELRWGAGDHAFAVTVGTSSAFLLGLIVRAFASSSSVATLLPLATLLASTSVAAWFLFYRSWSPRVRLEAMGTFVTWTLIALACAPSLS